MLFHGAPRCCSIRRLSQVCVIVGGARTAAMMEDTPAALCTHSAHLWIECEAIFYSLPGALDVGIQAYGTLWSALLIFPFPRGAHPSVREDDDNEMVGAVHLGFVRLILTRGSFCTSPHQPASLKRKNMLSPTYTIS